MNLKTTAKVIFLLGVALGLGAGLGLLIQERGQPGDAGFDVPLAQPADVPKPAPALPVLSQAVPQLPPDEPVGVVNPAAPARVVRPPRQAVEPQTPTMQAQSAAHLKAIGTALASFAEANDGALPDDLGELAFVSGLPLEYFFNPATGNAIPDDLEPGIEFKWISERGDYEMIPGLRNAGAGTVIAYEKQDGTAGGGVNVLFGDGHVEFLPLDRAYQAINQSLDSAEPLGPRG